MKSKFELSPINGRIFISLQICELYISTQKAVQIIYNGFIHKYNYCIIFCTVLK